MMIGKLCGYQGLNFKRINKASLSINNPFRYRGYYDDEDTRFLLVAVGILEARD